jgi:hypothetical protein
LNESYANNADHVVSKSKSSWFERVCDRPIEIQEDHCVHRYVHHVAVVLKVPKSIESPLYCGDVVLWVKFHPWVPIAENQLKTIENAFMVQGWKQAHSLSQDEIFIKKTIGDYNIF